MVDYYGFPKAGYYGAKKAFKLLTIMDAEIEAAANAATLACAIGKDELGLLPADVADTVV